MAKSTSPLTARPRPMAARMPGESADVVGVVGVSVALAKALDQRPAAASTAARSPADGGELPPDAWDIRAFTMASVADALCSVLNGLDRIDLDLFEPVFPIWLKQVMR